MARGLTGLSRGWAIGTTAWRRSLAKSYGQRALGEGLLREDIAALRLDSWEAAVAEGLAEKNRRESDLAIAPRKQGWKIQLAAQVREKSSAPIAWLALRLQLGAPASLRSYLCREKERAQQRTTA